jgi:RNA polymerase sigma-70 factor, ECF subfamily
VSGDHDFDAIWREAGPAIWRAVLVYAGGRRAIADDAVAEAFARAIERSDSVREPVPYLYRVAFRIAADDLKRSDTVAGPEDRAMADSVEDQDMLRAMMRLTPAQRGAIYLHYRADLPVRDVASMLGTSSAAVKVHLMRGRRRLAELLTEDDA